MFSYTLFYMSESITSHNSAFSDVGVGGGGIQRGLQNFNNWHSQIVIFWCLQLSWAGHLGPVGCAACDVTFPLPFLEGFPQLSAANLEKDILPTYVDGRQLIFRQLLEGEVTVLDRRGYLLIREGNKTLVSEWKAVMYLLMSSSTRL